MCSCYASPVSDPMAGSGGGPEVLVRASYIPYVVCGLCLPFGGFPSRWDAVASLRRHRRRGVFLTRVRSGSRLEARLPVHAYGARVRGRVVHYGAGVISAYSRSSHTHPTHSTSPPREGGVLGGRDAGAHLIGLRHGRCQPRQPGYRGVFLPSVPGSAHSSSMSGACCAKWRTRRHSRG